MSEPVSYVCLRQSTAELVKRGESIELVTRPLSIVMAACLALAALFAPFAAGPDVFTGLDVHPSLIAYANSVGVLLEQRSRVVGIHIDSAAMVFCLVLWLIVARSLLRKRWRYAGAVFVATLFVFPIAGNFHGMEDQVVYWETPSWGARPVCADNSTFYCRTSIRELQPLDPREMDGAKRAVALKLAQPNGLQSFTTEQKGAFAYEAAQLHYIEDDPAATAKALSAIPKTFAATRTAEYRIYQMQHYAKVKGQAIAPSAYRPNGDGRNVFDLVVNRVLLVCAIACLLARLVLGRALTLITARLRRIEKLIDKLLGRQARAGLEQRVFGRIAEFMGLSSPRETSLLPRK